MKREKEREKEAENARKAGPSICINWGLLFTEKVEVHGCRVDETHRKVQCEKCGNLFFHEKSRDIHDEKCQNSYHMHSVGREYGPLAGGDVKYYNGRNSGIERKVTALLCSNGSEFRSNGLF